MKEYVFSKDLYLSKSRYCSGVQCPKMLWMKKYKKMIAGGYQENRRMKILIGLIIMTRMKKMVAFSDLLFFKSIDNFVAGKNLWTTNRSPIGLDMYF